MITGELAILIIFLMRRFSDFECVSDWEPIDWGLELHLRGR